MTRQLQPCGTSAAYRRHKRAGETPCEPCTVARREYNRRHEAARQARTPRKPRRLAPCGTANARERHRRRGEQCAECDRIRRENAAARRTTPKPPPSPHKRTGSPEALIFQWGMIRPPAPDVARAAALTVANHAPRDQIAAVLDQLGLTPILKDAA